MKRILIISIILSLLLGFTTVSNAATEQELLDYMAKTYIIDGKEVIVPKKYIKEAQRYLDMYDITSEEADKVIEKIDEAVALFNKEKTVRVHGLSRESRKKLLSIAQEGGTIIGGKVIYTNPHTLTLIGEDGKTFAVYNTDDKFIQTGSQYYYVAGAAIIAIAGIFVYRKIK